MTPVPGNYAPTSPQASVGHVNVIGGSGDLR
jgi:hypothetical protein